MNFRFAILKLVLLVPGCAALKSPLAVPPDIRAERQQRHQEAVQQFEQRRDAAGFEAAMACWRMGDEKGCRRGLDELIRRNPKHVEAHLALADLSLCFDEPQQARIHAQEAVALAPQDARAQHALGQALEALGDVDGATAQFRRAVELDGASEIYRLSLENLLDPGGAISAADFAVASDVQAGFAPIGTPATTAPIAANPDTPDFAVAQAVEALRSNQIELAIRIATAGIGRFGGHAGLYRTLGMAHYRQGDYRGAQVALRQAVSLDKSHPLSYFLLSATLKKLGEEEEARRCQSQAEALDPALAAWR